MVFFEVYITESSFIQRGKWPQKGSPCPESQAVSTQANSSHAMSDVKEERKEQVRGVLNNRMAFEHPEMLGSAVATQAPARQKYCGQRAP